MQTTTPSFIRFLRARKFDVKAAFAQFSKYLIWRHEEKIGKNEFAYLCLLFFFLV